MSEQDGPRERGIIFSAGMMVALVRGWKTETRRNAQTKRGEPSDWRRAKPGDWLWTKEELRATPNGLVYAADGEIAFDPNLCPATVTPEDHAQRVLWWRKKAVDHVINPMFQPRWAARLRLRLDRVEIQRLHQITGAGVSREGLCAFAYNIAQQPKWGVANGDGYPGDGAVGWAWSDWCVDPRDAYARLFDGLHGDGAWEANPEVVVLAFDMTNFERAIERTPAISAGQVAG